MTQHFFNFTTQHIKFRLQRNEGVVSKVSTGQADAGIAYTTDAIASVKTVDAVPIPESQNIVAHYPIAQGSHLSPSSQQAADAFIAFVVGATGARILTDFGFVLP